MSERGFGGGMRLIIDNEGRVNLPQPLRQQLQLEPGDALEMESAGEQITLRPIRELGSLSKEKGVWMFHSGSSLTAADTDAVLETVRAERDLTNLDDYE